MYNDISCYYTPGLLAGDPAELPLSVACAHRSGGGLDLMPLRSVESKWPLRALGGEIGGACPSAGLRLTLGGCENGCASRLELFKACFSELCGRFAHRGSMARHFARPQNYGPSSSPGASCCSCACGWPSSPCQAPSVCCALRRHGRSPRGVHLWPREPAVGRHAPGGTPPQAAGAHRAPLLGAAPVPARALLQRPRAR